MHDKNPNPSSQMQKILSNKINSNCGTWKQNALSKAATFVSLSLFVLVSCKVQPLPGVNWNVHVPESAKHSGCVIHYIPLPSICTKPHFPHTFWLRKLMLALNIH